MALLFLLGAILVEVIGTVSTRASDGFTRPAPSALALVSIAGAYFLFSQSLKLGMGIGVAYSIWAAVGVAVVAIVGALFLGDTLTWIQVSGIVLVICGVVAVEMGGQH